MSEVEDVGAFGRLRPFELRQLGFTRADVRQAAIALAKAGEIKPFTPNPSAEDMWAEQQNIAEAIADYIVNSHFAAWAKACGTVERDWSQFFEQLMAFIEKLMPFIQMLLTIFGGL